MKVILSVLTHARTFKVNMFVFSDKINIFFDNVFPNLLKKIDKKSLQNASFTGKILSDLS